MSAEASGQNVVVTGASAGLGRAIVREFAANGANLGLIARGIDGLNGAKREVEEQGGRAVIAPADVSDPAQLESAAETIEAELGPIDVWVNNAMVSVFSPAMEITADEFRRVTEVTYLGFVYGTQSALRRMLPRNRGMIVQVGSALAYRGIPLQSAYCGAKHAIQGFTESLRSELIHDGSQVKITMVQMPALNTPQFRWTRSRLPRKAQPVPPIYQPEVGARAVYHAAYHYRREWNVGLMTEIVVQGNKFLPGVGDWYLAETGFESQMTDEPQDATVADDLFQPVPGDHGAHGVFDDRAIERSWEWELNKNRGLLALGGLAGLCCFLLMRQPKERQRCNGLMT
jgi:short-subunit dehydrogenase